MGLEAIKSYGNVSVQQTQNNISLQQSGQGSAEHVAGSVHTSSGMDNTYTAQNAQQVKQNTQPAQPTVEENITTEENNTVTIKIVDRDSKKVIKEIPPEKTLDMIAKVWELAGIMVDEKR